VRWTGLYRDRSVDSLSRLQFVSRDFGIVSSWFEIAQKLRYKPLSEEKLMSQPLSILTAGAVTTGSSILDMVTFELIIRRMNSRKVVCI